MRKASAETTEKERNNVEENAVALACYTKFRNIFKVLLLSCHVRVSESIHTL